MITQKRDLRTGRSVWFSRPMPKVPAAKLVRDARTDVLVIGAGISGALIAEALSSDREVMVVDRRGPVLGSTPASTALVEYEIDTPLIELAEKIGRERAMRAWQRSRLAVTALGDRTRALGIECDMVRRDSLYLAGNVLDAVGLREEAEARRSAGLETEYLERGAVRDRFGMDRKAALLSFDDIAVDPRRMTAGYLRAAVTRGAKIYAPVDVTGIETSTDDVVAATKHGPGIRCRYVIYATGYELPSFLKPKAHRIASTYAIATRPQRRRLWPEQCFIWEASDPYLYLRTTPDGRVICGGEDEDFADDEKRDALIPKKVAAIRRKLSRLLPDIDTSPEFSWAGAFGVSDTGLPLIGVVPSWPRCLVAHGFGGNGFTYSRIAADVISAALSGREDPDAGLYALSSSDVIPSSLPAESTSSAAIST